MQYVQEETSDIESLGHQGYYKQHNQVLSTRKIYSFVLTVIIVR